KIHTSPSTITASQAMSIAAFAPSGNFSTASLLGCRMAFVHPHGDTFQWSRGGQGRDNNPVPLLFFLPLLEPKRGCGAGSHRPPPLRFRCRRSAPLLQSALSWSHTGEKPEGAEGVAATNTPRTPPRGRGSASTGQHHLCPVASAPSSSVRSAQWGVLQGEPHRGTVTAEVPPGDRPCPVIRQNDQPSRRTVLGQGECLHDLCLALGSWDRATGFPFSASSWAKGACGMVHLSHPFGRM